MVEITFSVYLSEINQDIDYRVPDLLAPVLIFAYIIAVGLNFPDV